MEVVEEKRQGPRKLMATSLSDFQADVGVGTEVGGCKMWKLETEYACQRGDEDIREGRAVTDVLNAE